MYEVFAKLVKVELNRFLVYFFDGKFRFLDALNLQTDNLVIFLYFFCSHISFIQFFTFKSIQPIIELVGIFKHLNPVTKRNNL